MTAALIDAISDWFSGLRAADDAFADFDLDAEPEEELFDPSVSPLQEFR